ncbi:MAG: MarR family transcriptional regulator [Chromatiales bacterium]|jgi:DNA-binding MarR family transcriptional regulator|nr:MarR family transcriptional regulator [Chromatiales bacterium]MDP6150447.1 MarR family transcriptional regulator [Gammaproteobacteria bacterium]
MIMKKNKNVASKNPASHGAGVEFYGSDSDTYDVNESVGYLIKLAHKQLMRNVDAQLQAYDLTAMQWVPLQIISTGRGDTVAGCAREAGIDNGAMTRMLDRLEGKGLVRRQRSNDDRRVVNIALTNAGKKIAREIPPVISNVLNRHLQGFSQHEFELIKDLLKRFLTNGELPTE